MCRDLANLPKGGSPPLGPFVRNLVALEICLDKFTGRSTLLAQYNLYALNLGELVYNVFYLCKIYVNTGTNSFLTPLCPPLIPLLSTSSLGSLSLVIGNL